MQEIRMVALAIFFVTRLSVRFFSIFEVFDQPPDRLWLINPLFLNF
jgi:hypothetical protein